MTTKPDTQVYNSSVSGEEFDENAGTFDEQKFWCSLKVTSLFEDSCTGIVERVGSASAGVIIIVALVLNFLSFKALSVMKMNSSSLFLLKSLTIFDSLYLFGSLFEKNS